MRGWRSKNIQSYAVSIWRFPLSIFKPCDIRGVYPDNLDIATAERIGASIGTILDGQPLLIGGDVRLSTPELKSAVIRGLVSTGCHVVDLGILPTPAFYFARRQLGIVGGVMVTASHNPPQYNGMKIILGQMPITVEEMERVKSVFELGEFRIGSGDIEQVNLIEEYVDFIEGYWGRLRKDRSAQPNVRVVLDCGNGCYSDIAPRVLSELGIEFTPLFCEIDGRFPSRSPDSSLAANVTALSKAVVEQRADLGIAFDGDGDRVSFVDETGTFLDADTGVAVLAAHIPGGVAGEKVVLDIKCSQCAHDVVKSRGGIPLPEKSGHTFIRARMAVEDAKWGGEVSGHYFYRDLGYADDGLYTALLMTHIVSNAGKLSELRAAVPRYYTTPDIRLHTDNSPAVLDAIAAAFPPSRVQRLDGVKVLFDDGWALARISVTEPVLTLRFESKQPEALECIVQAFLSPVPRVKQDFDEYRSKRGEL